MKTIWVKKEALQQILKCNVVLSALKAIESSQWYLDSGCSRHMTGDKSKLTSLKAYQGGSVTFGDGSVSQVIGKGTISGPNIPTL